MFLVPILYLTVIVGGDQANMFLVSFDDVLFDPCVGEYKEYTD